MRYLLILIASIALAQTPKGTIDPAKPFPPGQPPALTAEQKLAIRTAQVQVLSIQAQAAELQKQMDAAQVALKTAIADAEKTCGTGLLQSDLSCAQKPAEKPKP